MSVEAINWALKRARVGSGVQHVVLVYLANYADDAHCAWTGHQRMARELGVPYGTARDRLYALLKAHPELIRREQRYDDSGRQTTNFYRLNVLGDWTVEDGAAAAEDGAVADPGEVPEFRQGGVGESAGEVPGSSNRGGVELPAGRGVELPAPHKNHQKEALEERKSEMACAPRRPSQAGHPGPENGSGRVQAEPSAKHPAIDHGRVLREWNEVALATGMPQVGSIGPADREKVRQRFRTPEFDWAAVLAKLREARGAWRWMNFRKLFRNDTTWRNLLDGAYDRPFDGRGADAAPPRVTDPGTAAAGVRVED